MENERKETKELKTELELRAKNGKLRLHFIYVVIILILILISIITVNFSGRPLNSLFVGYAATVSSLILSVLAIIITVIANDSTNGLMHKIRDIYEAISATPEKMSDSVACINNASDNLVNSVKSIEKISDKVENLGIRVNENLVRLEILHESLPKRITSDLSHMLSTQQEIKVNTSSTSSENNFKYVTVSDVKVDFRKLVQTTSFLGFIVLYAAYIACQKQKKLNLITLANATILPQKEISIDYVSKYFHGYFVGIVSFDGMINYNLIYGSVFEILNFNEELATFLNEEEAAQFLKMKEQSPDLFFQDIKDAIIEVISNE